MTKEELREQILIFISESEGHMSTAREIGEAFEITSQSASGSLMAMERAGKIKSRKFHAGMSDLKVYYLED